MTDSAITLPPNVERLIETLAAMTPLERRRCGIDLFNGRDLGIEALCNRVIEWNTRIEIACGILSDVFDEYRAQMIAQRVAGLDAAEVPALATWCEPEAVDALRRQMGLYLSDGEGAAPGHVEAEILLTDLTPGDESIDVFLTNLRRGMTGESS